MKLTPAQQHAKDNLRKARTAQKNARAQFDAEMEIAWRERSARVNATFDDAVREAVRLKLPKKQMQEAYGSKDAATMNKIIERVTAVHVLAVEKAVHVEVVTPAEFVLTLTNFDDWTDPENGTEALSGEVTYERDADGEWMPVEFTDLARAVDRELWINTPLRQVVAQHVPLDNLPVVDQTEDIEPEGLDYFS